VIGVPAYFNDAQRDATILACKLACVDCVRLLREPEAAALAYGIGRDNVISEEKEGEGELVLVFDLGGGTYDVSILQVGGGVMEVIATAGNNMLGGSDFDVKIAEFIHSKIPNLEKSEVKDKILRSAEAIRIYLSNQKKCVLTLPTTEKGWMSMSKPQEVIVPKPHANENYIKCELTRKEMENLCNDLFLSLLKPLREVAI